MQPESTYPQHWLDIAFKDLERVERGLRDEDLSLAGLYLQQALEKALKGLLLAGKKAAPRVHNLGFLLDAAEELEPTLSEHRELLLRVSPYYTVERYPVMNLEAPTADEIRAGLVAARAIVETIARRIVQLQEDSDV